jgi:hypothetical protein
MISYKSTLENWEIENVDVLRQCRFVVKQQTKGGSAMKEINNVYKPDDQHLESVTETDPVRDLRKLSAGDYRERDNAVFTIKKNLSPDHLTAIYWG